MRWVRAGLAAAALTFRGAGGGAGGRVAEVITRVEAGQPWLVAVEGDPGMGKTTLARRCLAQVADLRVLSARG